jgi:hypothetical protein
LEAVLRSTALEKFWGIGYHSIMHLIFRGLLVSSLLILISSCCRGKPPGAGVGIGVGTGVPIVFRIEVEEGTEWAVSFNDHGGSNQTIWFGPAHIYSIQAAFAATDSRGYPAVGFRISDHEETSFGDLTESIVDGRMAIAVDGKILTAPYIEGRLRGQGIITGGMDGYSKEQASDLVAFLQGKEGVNHSWERN